MIVTILYQSSGVNGIVRYECGLNAVSAVAVNPPGTDKPNDLTDGSAPAAFAAATNACQRVAPGVCGISLVGRSQPV